MRIIKPSVELIRDPDNMRRIELAARVCYKSEARIAEGSAEKMCAMLIRRGHTAMLEHSNVIVRVADGDVICDTIIETIGYHEKTTGKPSMIRWSVNIGSSTYTFSGNVRAWRELVRASRGDLWFQGDPLFADLPTGRVDLGGYMIGQDRLNHAERARHDIITARFVCAEGVSLEMFRHRMAAATYEEAPAVCVSPAQESTRYVSYGTGDIQFIEPWWWDEKPEWRERYESMCRYCELDYIGMRAVGMPPQAARAALTKAIKTEIILTQTPERWRDWLALREDSAAHPDMQICARLFREAAQHDGLM